AIRQKRPGAREAVRSLLGSTSGDSNWLERNREAARIFSETHSFLGKEDLDALRECASKYGHDAAGVLAQKALNPYTCADPLARDAAMQYTAKEAAKGNKDYLRGLCHILHHTETFPDDLRYEAASILSDCRDKLGPDEWSYVAKYADDRSLGS